MMRYLPLLLLISGFLSATTGCATNANYPLSDHFNGKTFFNPTLAQPPERSFFTGLKLWLSLDKTQWPESVPNDPMPRLHEQLNEDQVAVTFINHSTVLIQIPGLNILTDPIWSDRASPFSWMGPLRVRKPGVAFDDLPKIDLVIISHNHYDHMDLPTLQLLNKKFAPLVLVPLGNKELMNSIGIENVKELDWWNEIQVNTQIKVTSLPTQHFSGRGIFDRNKSLWGGYLIQYKNKNIYFCGDTAYSNYFSEISKKFGPIDLAFLPLGAYEPRWFMEFAHINPLEAVQAHLDLKSRQSIGIHFGTFQMSAEAIDQPVKDLQEALKQKKVPESEFTTLKEGRTQILKFSR